MVWYTIWADLWFQWIKTDYPSLIVMIPKKKPKKKELSEEQKKENKTISWIRVFIEHIIWWAKKYWIISNKYRNRTNWNFKTVKTNRKHIVMETACWLYNLWKYIKLFA